MRHRRRRLHAGLRPRSRGACAALDYREAAHRRAGAGATCSCATASAVPEARACWAGWPWPCPARLQPRPVRGQSRPRGGTHAVRDRRGSAAGRLRARFFPGSRSRPIWRTAIARYRRRDRRRARRSAAILLHRRRRPLRAGDSLRQPALADDALERIGARRSRARSTAGRSRRRCADSARVARGVLTQRRSRRPAAPVWREPAADARVGLSVATAMPPPKPGGAGPHHGAEHAARHDDLPALEQNSPTYSTCSRRRCSCVRRSGRLLRRPGFRPTCRCGRCSRRSAARPLRHRMSAVTTFPPSTTAIARWAATPARRICPSSTRERQRRRVHDQHQHDLRLDGRRRRHGHHPERHRWTISRRSPARPTSIGLIGSEANVDRARASGRSAACRRRSSLVAAEVVAVAGGSGGPFIITGNAAGAAQRRWSSAQDAEAAVAATAHARISGSHAGT